MKLQIKKLTKTAKLPRYAYPGDAGMDIFSDEDYLLKPGERHIFSTGIACQLPRGLVALVWDKGGLASRGVHTFAGVIDSQYRGEWFIILHNFGENDFAVTAGDKIAQILIQKVERISCETKAKLSKTARNYKKLGSSGKR